MLEEVDEGASRPPVASIAALWGVKILCLINM